jgi:hypothetical protein
MPAAFAEYLETFPSPPDWSRHPADSPLEILAVFSHRPAAMPLVLANVCAFLPGAAVAIVHGPDNRAWVREELLRGWDEAAHPGVRALELLPHGPFGVDQYTDLLERPELWHHFASRPRVLVIQPDTMLFRNTVLDFMNERYIGAPWTCSWHWGTLPMDARGGAGDTKVYPRVTVGNGGLSLRCPRLMVAAAKTRDMQLMRTARPITPEDIAYARVLGPKRLAHPLRARRFSVETCPFALPMGAHKPWAHLKPFALKEMLACAQEAPRPGQPVPRIWERAWRLVDARGRFPDEGELPANEAMMREAATLPDAGTPDATLARLRSWIRLGTNHRGFFCDEGAFVPLEGVGQANSAGVLLRRGCAATRDGSDPLGAGAQGVLASAEGAKPASVAFLLVIPQADGGQAGPAVLPVSEAALALRRCWLV